MDLYSIGTDYEEAKKDMIEEIDYAWSNFVMGDTKELDRKAIEYGALLKQFIKKVYNMAQVKPYVASSSLKKKVIHC